MEIVRINELVKELVENNVNPVYEFHAKDDEESFDVVVYGKSMNIKKAVGIELNLKSAYRQYWWNNTLNRVEEEELGRDIYMFLLRMLNLGKVEFDRLIDGDGKEIGYKLRITFKKPRDIDAMVVSIHYNHKSIWYNYADSRSFYGVFLRIDGRFTVGFKIMDDFAYYHPLMAFKVMFNFDEEKFINKLDEEVAMFLDTERIVSKLKSGINATVQTQRN